LVELGQPVPLSNLSTDANSGSPDTIDVESWLFVVPVFILKRSLRGVLLRDPALFWRRRSHRCSIADGFQIGVSDSIVALTRVARCTPSVAHAAKCV
jgi:hypothetical protein